ncbi:MAG: DUF47 family protein [Candidatus Marinimicrobia bacterium]|nr:DUF47 family protein [Candidatus Neomarinimicrobiota bacterium]RKY57713.1 MAG: DUF47 domain-containing protein [Candidatus Neomarinimicrobiota bacterium]
MSFLLRKTKALEAKIDEYLDCVIQGNLLFKQGIKFYLSETTNEFEDRLHSLEKVESRGDRLRREIETRLYSDTLIPESRGDVLGLLESTDRVLNLLTETLQQFYVEIPRILDDLDHLYMDLTDAVVSSVESMVMAIRAYFTDITTVRNYTNKVLFYETESDKIARKIKWEVFRTDLTLSEKFHMRYFAYHLELIADQAEDVCDRLSIAAIKRFV